MFKVIWLGEWQGADLNSGLVILKYFNLDILFGTRNARASLSLSVEPCKPRWGGHSGRCQGRACHYQWEISLKA